VNQRNDLQLQLLTMVVTVVVVVLLVPYIAEWTL